jgi:hypothetical protein
VTIIYLDDYRRRNHDGYAFSVEEMARRYLAEGRRPSRFLRRASAINASIDKLMNGEEK